MTIQSILAGGQAVAESLMTDTCRVTRQAAAGGSLDPVTGLPVSPAPTVVFEGRCRLRTPAVSSFGSARVAAGDQAVLVNPILSVPASAPPIRMDDRVEVLTSGTPALVGLVLAVSGLVPSSHMTAQRVQVTAVID